MGDLKTVHDRIRYLWLRSHQTQPEFASGIGIKQPHLSSIMKNVNPSRKLRKRISEATGASLEWLENGTGEPFPEEATNEPPELRTFIQRTRSIFDELELPEERFELAAKLLREAEKYRRSRQTAASPQKEPPKEKK